MDNSTDIKRRRKSTPCHEIDLDRNMFYVLSKILIHGDMATKLSFLIMGFSNLVRGQLIKGIIFLASELTFIWYMLVYGIDAIIDFTTLGVKESYRTSPFEPMVVGDDSRKCLLYGTVTFILILLFIVIWYESIRSGYEAQYAVSRGMRPNSFYKDILSYFDRKLYRTLLFLPIVGIVTFTIMPIIFMIFIAFTNYNDEFNGTIKLFDWVGFKNFKDLLGLGGGDDRLADTFWGILGWTIVWAILTTFLCYILGMMLAMLINRKGLKFKKMWRTIFIMSVAVPQFVSLLVMRTFLEKSGLFNEMLMSVGILSEPFDWFASAGWARFWVVTINIWVGVPYTLLIVSGILMNIPAELYEAAKVDGANAVVMFFKITLPYMIFVTTPYLITQFIGNINNFSVIYLLSNGAPTDLGYYLGAGKTDLLITWLYKLTMDESEYGLCSVIGILIFVITATMSLLTYRKTGAYNNEEEFQ